MSDGVFICPRCRHPLKQTASGFVCEPCGLIYPIEDGIPVLIPSRAVQEQKHD